MRENLSNGVTGSNNLTEVLILPLSSPNYIFLMNYRHIPPFEINASRLFLKNMLFFAFEPTGSFRLILQLQIHTQVQTFSYGVGGNINGLQVISLRLAPLRTRSSCGLVANWTRSLSFHRSL